jgi:Tfp pilus assembly protein PilV
MLKSRIRQFDGNTAHLESGITAFTMVEIVVALTILSVTIVAVFGSMRMCAKAAHHTRMLTKSVLLAERLLAETRISENTVYETREGKENLYQWKVQIAPTTVENLGAVHVQVQWLEQQRQQQYELFSLVQMTTFTERE